MYSYYLTIVLAPLFAAIVAGLFGHKIGRKGAAPRAENRGFMPARWTWVTSISTRV